MELFQGVLDQFSSILDVSMVQPVFGVEGLFWIFILQSIAVRYYLLRADRILREHEAVQKRNSALVFSVKIALLFLVIRPFCMAVSPEAGRFNSFLFNGVADLVLVASAFLHLRYSKAEEARFEEWTDIDAAEGQFGEETVS